MPSGQVKLGTFFGQGRCCRLYNPLMLKLSRTVRLCVGDGSPAGGTCPPEMTRLSNTFAAWPAMRGLGRYYEIDVACRGDVDPVTGYFINIKQIDEAVRDRVLSYLEDLIAGPEHPAAIPMGETMRSILTRLVEPLHDSVERVRLRLTPYFCLDLRSDAMDHVIVRQQYEFAAAHRLHVPQLSEQENRELFGKCNNAAGHGHNYRIEVAVRAPIDPAGHIFAVEELDDVVAEHVLGPLDHKHLNTDVPAFTERNPSVENIAKVIWSMLDGKLDNLGSVEGVELDEVTVWETAKTACTYRGPNG